MTYLRVRALVSVLAVVATVYVSLPFATAHADPEAPSLADAPTLALPELGLDPNLLFFGQLSTSTFSVPVPPGMAPESLNAVALLPVRVRNATIVITQGEQVITQADISVSGPVSIPLAGAQVIDDRATFVLRTYLVPLEDNCLDAANPLRLSAATVSFTGIESPPTNVADFLPPVLRKLLIFIPPTPSQAVADAAVQLATSVAAFYGKQAPAIEIAQLSQPAGQAPAPSGPLERNIVITESQNSSVSLIGAQDRVIPALQITGPATELTNQARLLTSGLSRYALTAKATAGPVGPATLPGDSTTIRDLGQPGITVSALSPQGSIALDQPLFGRAVHDIRVHLQGTYTPLPSVMGGNLVATVAGETVDHWAADSSGNIDRWVNVPNRLLSRNTALAIQLNVTGNIGQCGEYQATTLTITGDTEVTSSPSSPPAPLGFQSLPQALMPRVQVGIGPDIYADTVRAVLIMTGLQRLSSTPIETAVMPLDQAIDSSNPAVLISPQGWVQPKLRLPVSVPDSVPTTIDVIDAGSKPTTLTVDPELRFASLQTIFDGRRSVLVATSNGVPDQLDSLLNYLNGDPRRWAALSGVATLSVDNQEPVSVAVPVAEANPTPDAGLAGVLAHWWWIGVIALVIIVVAAALLIRRARHGPHRESQHRDV